MSKIDNEKEMQLQSNCTLMYKCKDRWNLAYEANGTNRVIPLPKKV